MKNKRERERNAMFTIFFTILLQQIPSRRLLQAIINDKKNNFSSRFKFEPVTT